MKARNGIEVHKISYIEMRSPLLNPTSWVIGELAVAKELTLQRWVADGSGGSHGTWYHEELLIRTIAIYLTMALVYITWGV